jgi:hypothetical protein
MDGYEYAVKVLYPMWNRESMQQQQHSASNSSTRERFKDELGIELPKDPIEVEDRIRNHIVKNSDNFYPELSPDYELWKSTKKSRWG